MATIATIIASQAVITGAFSLTRQAIQLGLLPRLEIRHTSETSLGPDLHPARQHHAAGRRAGAGLDLPHLVEPVACLWHLGVRRDDGRFAAGLHRDLEGLALGPARHHRRGHAVPDHRHRLLLGQPAEAVQRRLCAGAAGHRPDRADVDLGARHQDPVRQDPQDRRAAARTGRHAVARARPTGSRAWRCS